jgi:hypothetical protein
MIHNKSSPLLPFYFPEGTIVKFGVNPYAFMHMQVYILQHIQQFLLVVKLHSVVRMYPTTCLIFLNVAWALLHVCTYS